jgi:hypothetical protein
MAMSGGGLKTLAAALWLGAGLDATASTDGVDIIPALLTSLLALPANELVGLACDPMGSRHIIEALLGASNVSVVAAAMAPSYLVHKQYDIELQPQLAWARHKLFHAYKGWWHLLAPSRFGAWVRV